VGEPRRLSPKEALELVPQRAPFRFVDELVEIDETHVVATYTWRPDAHFYAGHFPGAPMTPGVLLLECMAQCGVVPLALFLRHLEGRGDDASLPLFTDASVDFTGIVQPGTRVEVVSRKVFRRRGKLRVEAEMRDPDGSLVCFGTLSGMEVAR
jgi:3-hydroxyacyl-[acyl-carrier-protein] dehydratase